MGARVVRMMRNFNLENRVHREISRDKPRAAPWHTGGAPAATDAFEANIPVNSVHEKNASLLSHLKSLYVESTDPEQTSRQALGGPEAERRPLKYSLPGEQLGLVELTDVPKGKVTLVEALKALSSHQNQPQTWTAEKIAQEYSLDLKDTKALVEFFIPFQVQIIPPKTAVTKRIKAS